jgi:hypothetical protein
VTMDGNITHDSMRMFGSGIESEYTVADVNKVIQGVQYVRPRDVMIHYNILTKRSFAPHRRDNWHRRCLQLEPVYRLSVLEYRRSGLVYPFGAAKHHFNTPNRTIFMPVTGQWLQSDHADPVESWEYVLSYSLC